MKLAFTSLFAAFLLISGTVRAQIESVKFPAERAVFQRNKNNEANVYVGGNYAGCVEAIEARLVPLQGGTAIDWITIEAAPTGGVFYGVLNNVKGGWYRVEVRTVRSGQADDEGLIKSVAKMGVGEVFVVAGQSNATGGDSNPNGPGATDDRVNSVDWQNSSNTTYSDTQVPCPIFTHLDASTKTAPFGNYAWCWGAFGDEMVRRLNVPVLIFNAGWSGAGVRNYAESIDPNFGSTTWYSFTFPSGMPYGHLRLALNNYVAQSGIRAVLWHQGESDNQEETAKDDYANYIKNVISATRSQSGKNELSWVVARASRFEVTNVGNRTWQPVIDAQNQIIAEDPQVFVGPDTDPYIGPNYRDQLNVHFTGNGLVELAKWWADAVNTDEFKSQSHPYAALAPPKIVAAPVSESQIALTAPEGWTSYAWSAQGDCQSSVSGERVWTTGEGEYRLKVKDASGNVVFTPGIKATAATPSGSQLAENNASSTFNVQPGVNVIHPNTCQVIGELVSSGASPVNGQVSAKVWKKAGLIGDKTERYVARHYVIAPQSNAAKATAKVKLLFSQAEFDQYNASAPEQMLPSGPDDTGDAGNILIKQYKNVGMEGNGMPPAGDVPKVISPSKVMWNASNSYWEVEFQVVGFSAFLLTTSKALPVRLASILAVQTTEGDVRLSWATTEEANASHFEVERSRDSKTFETLATIKANGNSRSRIDYSFVDHQPVNGRYYYRLRLVDLDGKFEYSRIVSAEVSKSSEAIKVFPNPVTDRLKIQSTEEIGSIEIFNSGGSKVLSAESRANEAELDVSRLPKGMYILRINGQSRKILKD